MNKIILFGAGKIGRSFIGQLFSRGGYEVVFIDIDSRLVDILNRNRVYRMVVKDDKGDEEIMIRNVRAIRRDDEGSVIQEIAGSKVIATAVGSAFLADIVPLIARGMLMKKNKGSDCKTDVIIAENMRNAARYFREILIRELGDPVFVDENIGLVETSIGKMVPLMDKQVANPDPLLVFAEPFNTLILDKKAFKNPIPDIAGLAPKENMKAWVDRKSFIHNLGHAAATYYGYLIHPSVKYLSDVLGDDNVLKVTRETMHQSAKALLKEHPQEFTMQDLTTHIDDLIGRFRNKALRDTVFRVGRDLPRKLGPDDRLVGALRMARRHHLSFDRISYILACGFYFRATDDEGNLFPADRAFITNFDPAYPEKTITSICGIDAVREADMMDSIKKANERLSRETILKIDI